MKRSRRAVRFRPIKATREVIGEARDVRSEQPTWSKNRSRVEAQLRAFQGLVFWNILERNKVARTAPLQLLLVAGYVGASQLRGSFSWTEISVLVLGLFVWYALEVVNSSFEYLLDEVHGKHFDERHARIKDMGAGASSLVAMGLIITAAMFCL